MHASNPDPRRFPIVAIVLLLTFLASLGAAAWIVRSRTSLPRQTAHDIIADMARKGLPAVLGPSSAPVWFLQADPSGTPLSLSAQRHVRLHDSYLMARVTVFPAARVSNSRMVIEFWQVANDLSTSDYRGGTVELDSYGEFPLDARDLTLIHQANGVVSVQRPNLSESQPIEAKAPVPPNLIPEGTYELAVRQVRDRDQKAFFSMIFDNEAVLDGQLHFAPVILTPLPPNRVRVTRTILEMDPMAGAQFKDVQEILELDSAGRIQRVSGVKGVPDKVRVPISKLTAMPFFRRYPDLIGSAEVTLEALTPESPAGSVVPAATSKTKPAY